MLADLMNRLTFIDNCYVVPSFRDNICSFHPYENHRVPVREH